MEHRGMLSGCWAMRPARCTLTGIVHATGPRQKRLTATTCCAFVQVPTLVTSNKARAITKTSPSRALDRTGNSHFLAGDSCFLRRDLQLITFRLSSSVFEAAWWILLLRLSWETTTWSNRASCFLSFVGGITTPPSPSPTFPTRSPCTPTLLTTPTGGSTGSSRRLRSVWGSYRTCSTHLHGQ